MKWMSFIVFPLVFCTQSLATSNEDPRLFKAVIDRLEWHPSEHGNPVILEADFWSGSDLKKLWLKSDVEQVDGKIEKAHFQVLAGRAISSFWDIQWGWQRDLKPTPRVDWGILTLEGLAPWFIDSEVNLLIEESGLVGTTMNFDRELLWTQRLMFVPSLDMTAYSQSNAELAIGSGLAEIGIGLSIRYEIRREVAPYIGLSWEKKIGETADLFSQDDDHMLRGVLGVRLWF